MNFTIQIFGFLKNFLYLCNVRKNEKQIIIIHKFQKYEENRIKKRPQVVQKRD